MSGSSSMKFPAIKLLLLDVDGVLTDGSINVDDAGIEVKRFHVRDGFAIKLWQRMGFEVGIVTGRTSEAVVHRAADLGIARVVQGSKDKAADVAAILAASGLAWGEVAFMGDDWPDVGPMRRCGMAMAPADASAEVLSVVFAEGGFVTKARGGHGAVREAIEYLLRGMGVFDRALGLYDGPA